MTDAKPDIPRPAHELGEPMVPDVPAAEELPDRLARVVASLIAVVALVATMVGYGLAKASRAADDVAVEAQRLAIDGFVSSLAGQREALSDYDAFVLAETARARLAQAQGEILLATEGEAAAEHARADEWAQIAARLGQKTSIRTSSAEGPAGDPGFPRRFFMRSLAASERLFALQDAANEERSNWRQERARLAAALTTLAVALYLLGLTLTLAGSARIAVLSVALALSLFGGVWSAVTAASSAGRAPAAAAEAYEAGIVLLSTGTNQQDFKRAIEHFTRALELRPRFAYAHWKRGDAHAEAGSAQRSAGPYQSSFSKPALEAALNDLAEARRLGLEEALLLNSLAAYEWHLAVLDDRPELVDRSIADIEAALELAPKMRVAQFNHGLFLLTAGRRAEAHRIYEQTASDAAGRKDAKFLAAAALTPLEILAHHRPHLRATVDEFKRTIVRGLVMPDAERSRWSGRVLDLKADVLPAGLVSDIRLDGYDPDRDKASVLWYTRASGDRPWKALDNESQLTTPLLANPDGSFGAKHGAFRCIGGGQYRVEVYINGAFGAAAETSPNFEHLDSSAWLRALHVTLCRPDGWRPRSLLQGAAEGFVSPDADRGVVVFRTTFPTRTDGRADAAQLVRALDRLAAEIAAAFGKGPTQPGVLENENLLGLRQVASRFYEYEAGVARGAIHASAEKGIVAAVVFGPPELLRPPGVGDLILDSITPQDDPVATALRTAGG